MVGEPATRVDSLQPSQFHFCIIEEKSNISRFSLTVKVIHFIFFKRALYICILHVGQAHCQLIFSFCEEAQGLGFNIIFIKPIIYIKQLSNQPL